MAAMRDLCASSKFRSSLQRAADAFRPPSTKAVHFAQIPVAVPASPAPAP